MRYAWTIACAAIIGLAAAAPAAAQSPQGLDETLTYIRDAIAAQGQVDYQANNTNPATGQNWTNSFSQEGSNVVVYADQCTISLHWRTLYNGAESFNGDGGIPFRQVDMVTVQSLDDYFAHVNAGAGHSGWTTSASPSLTVVTAERPDGVQNIFYFQDADLAERVAQAMRHAAELCGGIK